MNTEQRASSVLLDRGVGWRIPSPWWRPFRRTLLLSIKPLKLGTLLELSRIYTAMDIDENALEGNPHEFVQKNMMAACQIAAVCVLNTSWKIRLFTSLYARHILRHLSAGNLLEMMIFIATYSGIRDFMTTIRLIGEMKITTPKNLSPQDQGS